jgi:hypothetical protein
MKECDYKGICEVEMLSKNVCEECREHKDTIESLIEHYDFIDAHMTGEGVFENWLLALVDIFYTDTFDDQSLATELAWIDFKNGLGHITKYNGGEGVVWNHIFSCWAGESVTSTFERIEKKMRRNEGRQLGWHVEPFSA